MVVLPSRRSGPWRPGPPLRWSTTHWASSLVMSPRSTTPARAFMTLQHALSISHDSAKRRSLSGSPFKRPATWRQAVDVHGRRKRRAGSSSPIPRTSGRPHWRIVARWHALQWCVLWRHTTGRLLVGVVDVANQHRPRSEDVRGVGLSRSSSTQGTPESGHRASLHSRRRFLARSGSSSGWRFWRDVVYEGERLRQWRDVPLRNGRERRLGRGRRPWRLHRRPAGWARLGGRPGRARRMLPAEDVALISSISRAMRSW